MTSFVSFAKKILVLKKLVPDFIIFLTFLSTYVISRLRAFFFRFEQGKGIFVVALYQGRGRLARPFLHSWMGALTAGSILLAPVIAQEVEQSGDPWQSVPQVLSAQTENPQTVTQISDKPRDKIIEYTVQERDTIGGVAEKFGITADTIRWQNNLKGDKLKPVETLEILPVPGIAHKVGVGDTIYSIAKRYSAEPQAVVDFPFNTFTNDETFALAVGQIVIVPDGVPPKEPPPAFARRRTPDAGTVVASGVFVWPASGELSQRFAWYHKGVDIANKSAPAVLAADSGKIEFAGCTGGGYGCHIIINHGNGDKTLYAHLFQIYVNAGQNVARGNQIGKMGSTGRSTGVHLHFEVIKNGVYLNPLNVLK